MIVQFNWTSAQSIVSFRHLSLTYQTPKQPHSPLHCQERRVNPCFQRGLHSQPPCLCITRPSGHFLFLLSLCCTIPHQKYICSGAYFLKMDNLVKSLRFCFHLQFQTSSSTTCSSKSPFYSHEKEVNDPLIQIWSSDKMALVGSFDRNVKLSESAHIYWCVTPRVAAGTGEDM